MYNTSKQSIEQKRKQEKMNMVLNNLEQRLNWDEELCRSIAKIIDMTVEINDLESKLEQVETNIPVVEEKLAKLIGDSVLSCAEYRKNVTIKIYDIFLNKSGEPRAAEKLMKIHKTIEYCIANYLIYKKSKYYSSYSDNKEKTFTTLSIEDLLKL